MLGYDMGASHPLNPRRLQLTHDLLEAYGWFDGILERMDPHLALFDELLNTHSRSYLEELQKLETGKPTASMIKFGIGTRDNPLFPGIYSSSLLYTGASIDAAQAVNDGARCAFNISGGLHHAHYGRAAGFCVLNDCAAGIRRLRRKFARVAYIDIDVHHGDGVQESFYSDGSVLCISLHESGLTLFPGGGFTEEIGEGEGIGRNINLPFAPDTTDEIWIEAWRAAALPIIKAFDPEAIFLQMGADAHLLDPLGHLHITAGGWLEAIKDVKDMNRPLVAVGGGGYNLTTVPRMWTLAISTLLEHQLSDTIPQSFKQRDSISHLSDPRLPETPRSEKEAAELFAKRTVSEIRERIFPYYNLKNYETSVLKGV